MEKKITKIEIKNYRAFYNESNSAPYKIELPQGENLLIYGENGSGKSSFFHALYDFLASSESEINLFRENRFSTNVSDSEKYIEITYTDFDKNADTEIITTLNKSYKFDKINKPEETFIKDTLNLKAFLSYKDVLELKTQKIL